MAKTKAQLRAEAVERLRQFEPRWGGNLLDALLDGEESLTSWKENRDALIDLLTDDCGPCYSCAKLAELRAENNALRAANDMKATECDVRTLGVDANDANADTREKLEADMKERLGELWAHAWNAGCRDSMDDDFDIDVFNSLLDRQAAITSAEWERATDVVKAERDEWKAKAETRDDGVDCGHLADMSAKDAYCVRDGGEMSDVDSREKLEADVRQILHSAYMFAWMHGHENRRGGSFENLHREFYNLLDRQAAITEREFIDAECMKCAKADKERESDHSEALAERDDVITVLKAENAELQAKVDELTAQLETAHAKNRSLKAHIAKMQEGRHGWHVKGVELQREVDRLTRENVSLARDLGECMAERDSWRYRWHQVRVLMDEPLQCDRATLVDIDGEVVS